MNLQGEVPGYYRPLSLMLYQVMEDVGVTTEMKKLWQESAITQEVLTTLQAYPAFSWYRFGSSGEGTTTWGMKPDLDYVFIDNRVPVVADSSDGASETCFRMIQDKNIQPGYAKLQLVKHGILLTLSNYRYSGTLVRLSPEISIRPDKDNRLVCYYSVNLRPGQERHGPATFEVLGKFTSDIVYALNCSKWPVLASEWLYRRRHYNWPPPDIIDKCKSLGLSSRTSWSSAQ